MEPTEDRVSVYGGDYRPEDTPRTRPSAGVCGFNTSSVRPHINRPFHPDGRSSFASSSASASYVLKEALSQPTSARMYRNINTHARTLALSF